MTRQERIVNIIQDYKEGYFEIERINRYIVLIKSNYHSDKYISFDEPEVYQNIDDFIKYALLIQDLPENADILRMPFFAGCSGYDLGNFLLDEDKSLDIGLELEVDFSVDPVDFNINGLRYFLDYLDNILKAQPIFKGQNNFTAYVEYFIDKIEAKEWRINLILPLAYQTLHPDSIALQTIFAALKEARQEI